MSDFLENNIEYAKCSDAISLVLLFILFLFSGCEKEVSRSPVEPAPENNRVFISSLPTNAAIFLNGKNTGRTTPDSLIFLETGDYQLSLKLPYFKDTTITLSVDNDVRYILDVDFLSNPSMYGRVNIFSIPEGAEVFIDDSSLNKTTPLTITGILPGRYKVSLKKENFRDSESIVLVESSILKNVSVSLVDTSVWIDYQMSNSTIPSNLITVVDVDNLNNIWMGSWDKGLIKYDRKNFINFETSNSAIPSNTIKCLSISPSGYIWVGTSVGFAIFNGGGWNVINSSNSNLQNDEINSIIFDNTGKAWIATNNGFSSYDGISVENFNYTSPRVEYLWVTDLVMDENNLLWIGSNHFGILSYANNIFSELPDSFYNYPTPRISAIAVDMNKNVWFGHLSTATRDGGFSYYNGTAFSSTLLNSRTANIQDIYAEKNTNNIWISISEGLFFLDEANISYYYTTNNSQISNNNIKGVAKDDNNVIWIATFGGGLNKFKTDNQ